MTFTIADQMYIVEGQSTVTIELPPGEYTYTASLGLPRFGDIHGTVTVVAGIVRPVRFTCPV